MPTARRSAGPRRGAVAAALVPALLLAAGLAAPAAVAQAPATGHVDVNLTMDLDDPGGDMVPERPYALRVLLRYQYGVGGATGSGVVDRLPIDAPDPEDSPCADLTIVEAPSWATATLAAPRVCFAIPPGNAAGSTTVQNETYLELNVTPGAPALEPAAVVLAAHAPAQGVFAEDSAEANRTVRPAFVGRLTFEAPSTYTLQGGQTEEVPITVRNLGNGPIEVRFRNFTAPQGVRVQLPERFSLPVGDERVAYVTLVAPWTTPVMGQVQVAADSAHPERPDLLGDEPRVSFDIQGQAAVPLPGAGLLVLAVAGAALLAGRVARRRGRGGGRDA